MEFPRKLQLAKALVRTDGDVLTPASFEDETSLHDFLRFAARQQFAPTLYCAIGPERLHRDFPPRFAERLQGYYDQQCARHAQLLAGLHGVEALLRSRGVDCILLKGPVYAQSLYGAVDARQWDDLDILVRRAHLAAAQAALAGAGFQPVARKQRPAWIATRFDHAAGLSRGDVLVDLHWAIRSRPAYRLSEAEIWRAALRLEVAGMAAQSLSTEHRLVAAILEFAQDAERNAAKAKHLLDLYLMIRACGQDMDWAAFLARREAERLQVLTRNVFAVLLLSLQCGEEFPDLHRLVMEGGRPPAIGDASSACRLLDPGEDGAINRWWFGQVYPGNRLLYWGWLGAALVASPEFPRNVPALGRAWGRLTAALGPRAPGARPQG